MRLKMKKLLKIDKKSLYDWNMETGVLNGTGVIFRTKKYRDLKTSGVHKLLAM